jgi:hypothetical protein
MFKQSNESAQVNQIQSKYSRQLLSLQNAYNDNSHNTYETVCKLHHAWKEWQADRSKKRRTNPEPRTSQEEEEERQYEILMRQGDPLKRFQDPQVRPVILSLH